MPELPLPPAYDFESENEGQSSVSAPCPPQPKNNESDFPFDGRLEAISYAADHTSASPTMQPLGQLTSDNLQNNTNGRTYYMKRYDKYPKTNRTFLQKIGIASADANDPSIIVNAGVFDQDQTKLMQLNLFKNHELIKFSAKDASYNLLAELKNSNVSRLGLARSFYDHSSDVGSKHNIENNVNQVVASFGISRHPSGFQQPSQLEYPRAQNNNRRRAQPMHPYKYRMNIYDPSGKVAFYLQASELYVAASAGGPKTFNLYRDPTGISFEPETIGHCVFYTNQMGYYHEADLTKSIEITLDTRHINTDNERNLVFLLCYINNLFFTEIPPNISSPFSILGTMIFGVGLFIWLIWILNLYMY